MVAKKYLKKRQLCALALSIGIINSGYAQDGGELEEIQITGSRIVRAGMVSATPVTDVTIEELQDMDPGQMVEALSQLPQFFNNQRSGQVGWNTSGANLNLRGTGAGRTLILLDGRRIPGGNRYGVPNISSLPEGAIKNVETVTGGASAAYGTDAVAGVVNFILDTDFVGVNSHIQTGTSSRGDGDNTEFSITWGTDIGDKGHILVSGDIFSQDAIFSLEALQDRSWYKQEATVTNPDPSGPALITRSFARSTTTSPGGIINQPGSALNRLEFFNRGGAITAETQPFSGVGQFIGGCNCQALDVRDPTWGNDADNQIQAKNERQNLFVFADYDLTDNLNIYAQGIYGFTQVESPWFSKPFLSGPWPIRIFSGNPYLPADVQTVMDNEGLDNFTLSMIGDNRGDIENPFGTYTIEQDDDSISGTLGFNWTVGGNSFFTDWSVKGYYQYGRVDQVQRFKNGLRMDRLPIAMDAVIDPDTGATVCRAALANPGTFGDCVPVNLFGGVQSVSAEAAAYLIDKEKLIKSKSEQTFAELTMSGELHEGFGAGAIYMAMGVSHREDEIFQFVPNLEDEFVFLNGVNTGFRGLIPEDLPNGMLGVRPLSVPSGFLGASNLSQVLFTGSIQTPTTVLDGGFTVDEAFVEIDVPLLADIGMIQQLDANFAYRYADYSGSGGIDSWKYGLSWTINDQLRIRATRSRDVRAASLRERFDETAGGAAVTDPFNGNNFIFTASRSKGNPFVDPEEADTLTFGAIYEPEFLPGFSLSLDWYDIGIKGALDQPGFQDIVDNCFLGAQEFCDLIERDPVTDLITRITTIYFNVSDFTLKGIDLEMRYTADVSWFGGDESLTWRLLGTKVNESSQLIPGAPRDYLDRAQPEYRYTTNLTYQRGPFRAFVAGRFTDGYLQNRFRVEGIDVDDNSVSSVFYTDLRLSYDLELGNKNWNIFGTVTNLFDTSPPAIPGGLGFAGGTNGVNGLYDAVGRRYVVGLNLNF